MKKIYINPTTTVVKIKPVHLLSGSETIQVSNEEYDGSATVESRQFRGSIWDDEEEEPPK